MGDFIGHAFPGTIFIIISLWHTMQICIHYFRYKTRGGPVFQSATYFAFPYCSKLPLEPIIKLTAATLGFAGEVIMNFRLSPTNLHHMCMYSIFGLGAFLLEILHHYKFHLPEGILHISYALGFSTVALLFYWHFNIQHPLDTQVHALFLMLAVITACCLLVEINHRGSVLVALCRTYLILLLGLWFWSIAMILDPPSGWQTWDGKSHKDMMLATVLFCAAVFVAFAVILAIWFAVACRYGLVRETMVLELKKEYYSNDSSTSKNGVHKNKKEKFEHDNEDESVALIIE